MHNSSSEIMESECELVFSFVLALGELCHSLVCFWCCWMLSGTAVWSGGCLPAPCDLSQCRDTLPPSLHGSFTQELY